MLHEEEYIRFAEQYMDTVYRVAFSYVKNSADADDVTQAVFLRLWKRRPTLESDEHARRWLIRVAVNESKRLLRAPWRMHTTAEELEMAVQPDTEHGAVWDAVFRLKPDYRAVVCLHYYEGFKAEEIAAMLNIPKNTVLTRLSRAREALRKELTEVEP